MISTSRVPLGVYSPGNTVVHRAPAGIKLLVLTVFILSTAIFVSTWQWAAVSVGMVVLTAAVARIPARLFVRQLSGALPLLIFIALMLWWRTDGEQALTMFLVLLSAIAAAIL